ANSEIDLSQCTIRMSRLTNMLKCLSSMVQSPAFSQTLGTHLFRLMMPSGAFRFEKMAHLICALTHKAVSQQLNFSIRSQRRSCDVFFGNTEKFVLPKRSQRGLLKPGKRNHFTQPISSRS